jgi:hypothetical protein
MSDPFNTSEYENDVGLDEEDKGNFRERDVWLKMSKGEVRRASFVYFHTVDVQAVQRAMKAAKDKGEKLTPEQLRLVQQKALEDRATALGKSVDQLTETDKLFLDECKFKKMRFHYQPGLGMVLSRMGMDGADADAVWKRLEEAKLAYTTLMLVYPTDRKGEINKATLATDWQLIPWRFAQKTYETIWKLNAGLRENGMGLHTQDLKLECKDEKYQNIDVSFVGQAIWRKSPKFQTLVLDKALSFYDKLVPFRNMTTDQLKSKLGMGGSAVSDIGAAGSSSGGDFTDLLDQV